MASAQEVELLRRQLDELTGTDDWNASTVIKHCDHETAPRGCESWKARAVRTWQRLWRLVFHIQRIRGYARSCLVLPCWKQRDNHQQWWWRLHHTNSSLQHCCTSSRCSHRREHEKWWEKLETTVSKLTDNCAWCTERPIRKAARDYSCKSWLTNLVPRLKTWKTVWTNFWNWWDDTMRRTVQIPFPTKWKRPASSRTRPSLQRHIFSWMWLNCETSTNYAWRLRITWGADASSRRLQPENTHDEDSMEVDAVSRKGKAKKNPARARKVARKEKESHSGKGYGETTTEHSRFDGECRNSGKYGHKASDCWYKQTNKSQGKGKGTRQSKSKVTEISESDNNKKKSMIGFQVQTRPHSSQIYLKWTGLDAQMRDFGYFRWKTARNVGTRWIEKISLVPIWLRSGKLRSTSWWSILDVLDMSAHRG